MLLILAAAALIRSVRAHSMISSVVRKHREQRPRPLRPVNAA